MKRYCNGRYHRFHRLLNFVGEGLCPRHGLVIRAVRRARKCHVRNFNSWFIAKSIRSAGTNSQGQVSIDRRITAVRYRPFGHAASMHPVPHHSGCFPSKSINRIRPVRIREATICSEDLHSAVDRTPYEGMKIRGQPVTIPFNPITGRPPDIRVASSTAKSAVSLCSSSECDAGINTAWIGRVMR